MSTPSITQSMCAFCLLPSLAWSDYPRTRSSCWRWALCCTTLARCASHFHFAVARTTDTEQWAEIKLHPQEGAAAILAAAAPGQEIAAVVAFEHHARFDRQGYPGMTYSRPAHFFSRLVSTADTYDALTTRRSYRRAETPNRALRVLLQGGGTLYDPIWCRRSSRWSVCIPSDLCLNSIRGRW